MEKAEVLNAAFFSAWFSLVRSVFWPPRSLSLVAEPVGMKHYLLYLLSAELLSCPPPLKRAQTHVRGGGARLSSFSLWAAVSILDLISPGDVGNFTKAKQRFVHKTWAANFALEVGLKGSICSHWLSMAIVCLTPWGLKCPPSPGQG